MVTRRADLIAQAAALTSLAAAPSLQGIAASTCQQHQHTFQCREVYFAMQARVHGQTK